MKYMLINALLQYDISVFRWINNWPHGPFSDFVARFLHYGTRGMLIYILLYGVLLLMKKYNEALFIAGSMLLTAGIVNYVLKPLIHRSRPFITLSGTIALPALPITLSFPSAETAAAFSVSAACNLVFRNKWWRLMWIWAVIVGLDRIYMGHHYPSDVLAGALVGSAISVFTFLIFRRKFSKNLSNQSTINI